MKRFSFQKSERLTSQKRIEKLFKRDQQDGSVKVHPFVFTWRFAEVPTLCPVQVVMVASKKGVPKATDRARIKRQMRELYRYRKHELYDLLAGYPYQLTLALIYTGKGFIPYARLRSQFDKGFRKVLEKLAESPEVAPDWPHQSL